MTLTFQVKFALAAAASITVLCILGARCHRQAREECEASGGRYVVTGHTYYVDPGSNVVQEIDTYGCVVE